MDIIKSYSDLQTWRARQTQSVGFVPTMGALHNGHLSLINIAKTHADITIASIFVNPTQFAPHEDLDQYPRHTEKDCALLKAHGVNAVYIPETKDIYPNGVQATLKSGQSAHVLEGTFRPTHFDGVVTVVGTLFDQIKPDVSIFGEKDYQQLCVLRETFPTQKIIGAPIIRDENGLALSSRNAYLSADGFQTAVTLNQTLFKTADRLRQDTNNVQSILDEAQSTLIKNGFTKVDYVALCNESTLQHLSTYKPPPLARLLAAAYVGTVRLIDNIAV